AFLWFSINNSSINADTTASTITSGDNVIMFLSLIRSARLSLSNDTVEGNRARHCSYSTLTE
ncbi:MAG: hypothetical protein ACRDDP_11775, partial [Plesiomonas sp.]